MSFLRRYVFLCIALIVAVHVPTYGQTAVPQKPVKPAHAQHPKLPHPVQAKTKKTQPPRKQGVSAVKKSPAAKPGIKKTSPPAKTQGTAKPAAKQVKKMPPATVHKKPLVAKPPVAPLTPKAVPKQSASAVVPKVMSPTAMQKTSERTQRLVVIDPGHGGYDLGARMSACDEKSLALSTALLTKKYLTEMGYAVILTRTRDVFMALEKRTFIANQTKSKIFVSIHYNAAKNPIAQGIEVFYHASSDKFRTGSSKKLAARVLSKLIDRTVAENRGIKEGNFYVIRETKMPAILIEAGFMTHPEELHRLKDINYRDKIARGIAEGIDSFFKV